MKNGLYQVTTNSFCAGFIVANNEIIQCAPILKRNIKHWQNYANYIGDNMQIRGVVVSVEFDVEITKAGGNGVYQGARFTYRGSDGKVAERNFHNNVFKYNAALKTQLSNLVPNTKFIMNMEKPEGNKYWEVKSVVPDDGTFKAAVENQPVKSVPSPKNTYETPEERAKKQIYIVRQSSVSSAVEFLATTKGKTFTIDEVIDVAKKIESYVLTLGAFDDMQDDIPQ